MKVLHIPFATTFTRPSMIETISICIYSPNREGAGNKTEPRSAGMKPTHVGQDPVYALSPHVTILWLLNSHVYLFGLWKIAENSCSLAKSDIFHQ